MCKKRVDALGRPRGSMRAARIRQLKQNEGTGVGARLETVCFNSGREGFGISVGSGFGPTNLQ